MNQKFIISGGKQLKGELPVRGSKNATLALLAASVISDKPCHLTNIPDIGDVHKMVEVLKSIGVKVETPKAHELIVHAKELHPETLAISTVGHIRASIMIMGALAARIENFTIFQPGGCQIGSRPLDAHFSAFKNIGFDVRINDREITIKKQSKAPKSIVQTEFSVTATINTMLAATGLTHPLTIYCAAQDHSVVETAWFLESLGVKVDGIGTHTLTIAPAKKLQETTYTIMPDPIEAGTWLSLAVSTRSPVTITNVAPEFLRLDLEIFKKIGAKFEITNSAPGPSNRYHLATITVHKKGKLKAIKKVHTMPAPGFNPDLLPPFSVILTQAEGTSLIHDWMYDGRLRYITELVKMGANAHLLNPHQAIIIGPTPLFGKQITSFDLRAGATLIIAALTAQGESEIDNIYQVDRGYENIDERLKAIGADIKRV